MTDREIVEKYQRAGDKLHILQVLADLNVTTPKAIRAVLERAGEALPGRRPAGDPQERRRLYDQGLNDGEIAWRTGCARSAINAWRNRNGLPPNDKRGRR